MTRSSRTGGLRRALPFAVLATTVALGLTGCRFEGVNALPLPGGVGGGDGSYTVQVELPDVGTLKPNAQVKVGDIAVGTITSLATRDWHAVANVRLGRDVQLPQNAVAAVGQNSLLGASYLEMSAPTEPAPTGRLVEGDVVPLANTRAYPTTEEVLAATSLVLNGGGLNQLSTVTRELDRALGGDDGAVGRLLPQLDTFVTGLDAQRNDITTAIDGLDRLSGQLAGQTDTITGALDQLGPALQVLDRERDDLVTALDKLKALSATGSQIVAESGDNLTANLRDLQPVLKSLGDTQDHLVGALGLVLTFPFPAATTPNACRGDYCNLSLMVDLQLSKIDANLLSGTPLEGSLFGIQNLLGGAAPGSAGGAGDPLRDPLDAFTGAAPTTNPSAPPATPAPSPAPAAPADSGGGSGGLLGSLLGGGR
ncbi:MCE family protein [Pseudonocardia halophobica]|uniref:Mammalian cell entry protein n=1 Tax=Pseudonocardia halophobica TaxID=29401 RepID=A0A9W6KYY4_9PSEU|nr:MCE family protein [Pseudonocardia halophobica]GLL09847.1 mammalian cell entry protein [Pseudonocardia halophobica]